MGPRRGPAPFLKKGEIEMTAEELSMIAGVLLSLGFSYIPGMSDWYARLSPEKKRLLMLGLLAAVALAVFGLACTGFASGGPAIDVTCDSSGAIGLLNMFILAVISNQAVFLISPKKNAGIHIQPILRWEK
jgi:hypothetical protein